MTAYELADLLEDDIQWTVALNSSLPERLVKASAMLRQQQAEIENLKTERATMFGFVKSRGEVGQLIMYKASQEAQANEVN